MNTTATPDYLPQATARPLPYQRHLQQRTAADITLLVLHCTELPDLAMARDYGEKILYPASQTGNSGHFYIDTDGTVEQWVGLHYIAHHVRGHNAHSIGIELVNIGRYPHWYDSRHQHMQAPYPAAQMRALVNLIQTLCQTCPTICQIAGHEDLDTERIAACDNADVLIARKRDPGELFDWNYLLSQLHRPLQRVFGEAAP